MVSKPKQVPMCVVKIGFESYLMPSTKGLKLVELVQGAVRVEYDYQGRSNAYIVGDEVSVEYQSIKASQLRARPTDAPPAAPRGPLLIER